jgi:hypothetical protein
MIASSHRQASSIPAPRMLNCIQTTGNKMIVKSLFDSSTQPFHPATFSKESMREDGKKEAVIKLARERHEEFLRKK